MAWPSDAAGETPDHVARTPGRAMMRRTVRVALIAGAIGSVAGAAIVMAAVATVLSVTRTQSTQQAPSQDIAAPQPEAHSIPPAAITAAAKPEPAAETVDKPEPFNPLAESPVGKMETPAAKEGCEDQTWPNIESRCLTRVAPRETIGPSVAPHQTAKAPAKPPELRPGSPAVPASPRNFSSPQPAGEPTASQPGATTQAAAHQAAPSPEVTKPAAEPKPKSARKAERRRAPPKEAVSQRDDDDGLEPAWGSHGERTRTITINRDRPGRRTVEVIEEVIERPARRHYFDEPTETVIRPPGLIPNARFGGY